MKALIATLAACLLLAAAPTPAAAEDAIKIAPVAILDEDGVARLRLEENGAILALEALPLGAEAPIPIGAIAPDGVITGEDDAAIARLRPDGVLEGPSGERYAVIDENGGVQSELLSFAWSEDGLLLSDIADAALQPADTPAIRAASAIFFIYLAFGPEDEEGAEEGVEESAAPAQ